MLTRNDVLDGMLVILAEPKSWIRHELAQTADHTPVEPHDPAAVCFCLIGAKNKTIPQWAENETNLHRDVRKALKQAITHHIPFAGRIPPRVGAIVAAFNDHPETTHQDVIEVIRLAKSSP